MVLKTEKIGVSWLVVVCLVVGVSWLVVVCLVVGVSWFVWWLV